MNEKDPQRLRCGQCEACRRVEVARRVVLSESYPAGSGIRESDRRFWNEMLRSNPCKEWESDEQHR